MAAISGQHGLEAACPRIDNRQPAVTKSDISISTEPNSLAVRAAMR
jgi:hypothetical protein